jgi:predicted outer membrane protein
MSLQHFLSAGTLCAALALPLAANAQQKPERDRSQAGQRPGAAGQQQEGLQGQRDSQDHANADSKFAACLIIDNQKEIALAKLAQQNAQNEQVKAFAEKMVQDHQQFVQLLQEIAAAGGYQTAQLTVEGGAQGTARAERGEARQPADTARTPTERRAARPELDTTGAQGPGIDFVSLKQEIAQECVKSATQELQEKSGAEFDQCYMFGQVMAHMAMADVLKVFSRHASPQLQQVLQEGQQTTQAHLQEAKQIAQQLEQGTRGGRQSQKSGERD